MKKENQIFSKFVLNKFLFYNLHLGSSKLNWQATNKPYLIGVRSDFCIFNAKITYLFFRRALKILTKVIFSRKKILFVGAPKGLEKDFFFLCKKYGHYHVQEWIYGFFTNNGNNKIENYSVLPNVENPPSLIFIFDLSKNKIILDECLGREIPIMAFLNSSESSLNVDYIIPANINSTKGALFALNVFRHLFQTFSKRLNILKK